MTTNAAMRPNKTAMRPNKTAALRAYLARYAGLASTPGPDRRNGKPGTGWSISPHQTATKAAPAGTTARFWSGKNPTPSTQMPTPLALAAADWLRRYDAETKQGGATR